MDFFTFAPPLEGLALKSFKGASCQLDVAALEGAPLDLWGTRKPS